MQRIEIPSFWSNTIDRFVLELNPLLNITLWRVDSTILIFECGFQLQNKEILNTTPKWVDFYSCAFGEYENVLK